MKLVHLIEKQQSLNPTLPWNKNPDIGWWLDKDPVTFYHGTHIRNIPYILEHGIKAPESGPTAGWVSLALEPNTAFGYASMSGQGGESEFRSAGTKAKTTPPEERAVLVVKMPQSEFLSKMGQQRGNVEEYRDRLIDKEKYIEWNRSGKADKEYYAITEIRYPKLIPSSYIVGWMKKI